MGAALAPIQSSKTPGEALCCPKCGSSWIQASRRRFPTDWVLIALQLNPYRCTQCMRRFYRFGSRWARRVVIATLCLIPLIVLAVWFFELYSLDKFRSLTEPAPEPSKSSGGLARPSVEEILSR